MQVFIANNEVMFINTQLRKSPFGEIFLDPNSDILIEIRKQEEEKVNFFREDISTKTQKCKVFITWRSCKNIKSRSKIS